MQPNTLNRKQRRAQYAVASRSKPYRPTSPHKQAQIARGRNKILNFIDRGILLSTARVKRIPVNEIAKGVRRAILGR